MNSSNSSVTASQNQGSSTTLGSFLRYHRLPYLVVLSLLLLLLFILVLFLITKCSRKKPRKIQRQGVIIKKNPQSPVDDPDPTLLEQNSGKTIDNIRCLGDMFVSDRKNTYISLDTPRYSTISMTKNAVNEINDIDDLSDLDLANIPLRLLNSTNQNPNDPSSHQTTKRSSYSSSENLYMNEFRERAGSAARQHHNQRVSLGSKTSEESCI
jgi:hypothetical protein